ncbi:unnamed protein product [Cladocopium goreaui]|uniref:Uncharacterized protein n=1 Tax=Cladocopium goreaui TaxID=2562237 RepID=A0A9P1BI36_9DINO|nr:unnamed protein product [Cladocopium goreaui]
MLAQQLNWWGPGTFQEQLEKAYQDFVAYCRTKKLGHSQPPFKLSKVKMKKTGEIMLAAKAWNGRVVCSWLADTMVLACAGADPGFDEGRLFLESHAATSMAQFFWLTESNPRELCEEEAHKIYASGHEFLRSYRSLCTISARQNKHEFPLKPKYHAFLHVLREVKRFRKNPRFTHTYIDEDAMLWAKSTSRFSHPKKRAIWLIKCQRLRLKVMKHKMKQLLKGANR